MLCPPSAWPSISLLSSEITHNHNNTKQAHTHTHNTSAPFNFNPFRTAAGCSNNKKSNHCLCAVYSKYIQGKSNRHCRRLCKIFNYFMIFSMLSRPLLSLSVICDVMHSCLYHSSMVLFIAMHTICHASTLPAGKAEVGEWDQQEKQLFIHKITIGLSFIAKYITKLYILDRENGGKNIIMCPG